MVGPHLRGVMAKFNQEDPTTLASRPDSTFVSAISKAIRQVPDIAQNPALRSKQALDILMGKLSPVIITWASEQCIEALRAQELGQAPPLPLSVLETVSSTLEKLNSLLPQPDPMRRMVPWAKSKAVRQSLLQPLPDHCALSLPRIEQSEELQVQSLVASESGTIPEGPDDLELPSLTRPTAIDFEMDEAELQRRRRKQRRLSGRISNGKQAGNQGTRHLPVPEATKAIPAGETTPANQAAASLLTVSRLSSKGKRSWTGRPAAQPKLHGFVSNRSLSPRRKRPMEP